MRIHRFIGNFDLKKENLKIQEEGVVKQIKNVLRLKEGDTIALSDGRLNEAEAKISSVAQTAVDVSIIKISRNQNESDKEISLFCSNLKHENFELVVQKSTEAGVSQITPLICARTVKQGVNLDRLRKIAKEAAEQSERGIIPRVNLPLTFEDAVDKSKENELNFFFDKKGQSLESVKGKIMKSRTISIFTGPEGGWSDDEIKFAEKNFFLSATLGKLTLRAETAAIVATWFIASE